MSIVMAATGRASQKRVNDQNVEVIPFVGGSEGDFSSFGVGFIAQGKCCLWGLAFPHLLIQSWRAMKILEHVPEIFSDTLCACWYAAKGEVTGSDAEYVEKLAGDFPSRKQFDRIRAEALAAVPTPEELNGMLTRLKEKSVEVQSYELTQMVASGLLAPSPLIDEIVQREADERREFEENEAIIKAPMPPEESLASFFADLGLGNFTEGVMEWVDIKLADLDSEVKRVNLGKYGYPFKLRLTTIGPEVTLTHLYRRNPKRMGNRGTSETPFYRSSDGTTYTFKQVVFKDGKFLVDTSIEKKGQDTTQGQYTIPQLREMIGLHYPTKKRGFRWPLFSR